MLGSCRNGSLALASIHTSSAHAHSAAPKRRCRTGNLRAVQLLLDHRKIERTVRYLGIEVDDALAIAEQVDV